MPVAKYWFAVTKCSRWIFAVSTADFFIDLWEGSTDLKTACERFSTACYHYRLRQLFGHLFAFLVVDASTSSKRRTATEITVYQKFHESGSSKFWASPWPFSCLVDWWSRLNLSSLYYAVGHFDSSNCCLASLLCGHPLLLGSHLLGYSRPSRSLRH